MHLLVQAYLDLLTALEWKSFTILYENNEGLIRLQVGPQTIQYIDWRWLLSCVHSIMIIFFVPAACCRWGVNAHRLSL
jgi:hypothetical protein